MTWEDIKNMKEDSLRESTKNPKKSFVIEGKTYNSYTEYANSDEYKQNLKLIEEAQTQYKLSSQEFFDSLSYDDKLKCFFHVINCIYKNIYEDKGSYRHLLYSIFNFGPDSYALGIDCGLMTIHNDVCTHEDIDEALNRIFTHLNHIPSKEDLLICYGILRYGQVNKSHIIDMLTGQLKFDFSADVQDK